MIVKLLSFKPNKDGSVTLYLDKGADLHSLIDMTGKEIEVIVADKPIEKNAAIYALHAQGMRLLLEAHELGKQEEQARHDHPAPEGE